MCKLNVLHVDPYISTNNALQLMANKVKTDQTLGIPLMGFLLAGSMFWMIRKIMTATTAIINSWIQMDKPRFFFFSGSFTYNVIKINIYKKLEIYVKHIDHWPILDFHIGYLFSKWQFKQGGFKVLVCWTKYSYVKKDWSLGILSVDRTGNETGQNLYWQVLLCLMWCNVFSTTLPGWLVRLV